MKHIIFATAIAVCLTACAPAMYESHIDTLPDEYMANLSEKHLLTYFATHEPPIHRKYGKASVVDGVVRVQLTTDFMDTPLGVLLVKVVDKNGSKVVTLHADSTNSGWMTMEQDIVAIRKDLTLFLMGGRR